MYDSAITARPLSYSKQRGAVTDVVLVHERIADAASRDQHAQGWNACLDGLAGYLIAAA